MKRMAALAFALLCIALPAAAQTKIGSVAVRVEAGIAQIEGTVSEAGAPVTVAVLKEGFSQIEEDNILGSCVYVRTVAADSAGRFLVEAALPGPGEYPLAVSVQGAQYRETIHCTEALMPARIYIAADGSDAAGSGTEQAPYATFEKALDAAQAYLASTDTEIIFRGGVYRREKACVIRAAEGGRGGHTLTVRSAAGETVRLLFSRTVTGWEAAGGSVWRAPLRAGEAPSSLYENETLAVPARSPNRKGQENRYEHSAKMDTAQPNQVFYTQPGQFPQPQNIDGLEVFLWPGGKNGHYNWSTQRTALTAFDAATGRVELARQATYEVGAGSRYFLQGASEFLDAPGEFYADRQEGWLYYIPYDPAALEDGVELPLCTDGFRLEAAAGETVRDVHLQGLEIQGIDTGSRGMRMMNARGCVVDRCTIQNVGYRGITAEGASSENQITNNVIQNTGSDGIAVMGTANTPERVSFGNKIENNQVEQVGWCDGNAGCIRVYDSAENVIRRNRVSGSPRYGIHLKGITRNRIIGETYGGVLVTEENFRSFQKTKDNLVEGNDVSDVMRDSQDCGAIATWGVNTGNIIRGNRIHDCAVEPITLLPERTFVFGIYMDEDSDGVLVERNLITGLTAAGGAKVLGLVYPRGTGITVQNNVFAENESESVFLYNDTYDSSGGAYGSGDLRFVQNIALNCGGCLYAFQDAWTADKIKQADGNLFWDDSAQPSVSSVSPPLSTWEDWKALGFDAASRWTKISLADPAAGDCQPDAPTAALMRELGIETLDLYGLGLAIVDETGAKAQELREGESLCAQTEAGSGLLILAVYRGQRLEQAVCRDLDRAGAGKTAAVTVPAGATNARAMLWDGETMTPVCAPVQIG